MALQGSEIESLTNFENLLKTMIEETDNNQVKHETEKFLFELDSLSKQARAAQKSLIDLYFTLANEPESDSPIIDSIAKAFSDNFNLNGIPRMRLNECSRVYFSRDYIFCRGDRYVLAYICTKNLNLII